MHVALGGGGGSVVQHCLPSTNLAAAHDVQRLSRRPAELALQVQQVALGLRLRQDLRAVGGALREPARHLLADALEDASEEPTAG